MPLSQRTCTCTQDDPNITDLCKKLEASIKRHRLHYFPMTNTLGRDQCLHDLVLRQATSVLGALHSVAVALVGVFDVRQAKRSATILVAGEFSCPMSVTTPLLRS